MLEENTLTIQTENGSRHPVTPLLRSLGRKLFQFKPLSPLKVWARRAMSVAEPPGKLSIQAVPERDATRRCGLLTVVSANLWHDYPRHRRLMERLDAFAELMERERADVILLQEVARTPELRADRWLADRLGMAYIYSRANGHADIGFEEGLAVLSRFALSSPHLAQLGRASGPFVRRIALGAAVDTPCGSLLAFSVHLSLSPGKNRAQVSQLQSWIRSLAGSRPAVVGGDFNSHETTRQIQQARRTWLDTFRHLHPQADGTTHLLHWPWGRVLRRLRLDYIFLHSNLPEWTVVETRHLYIPGAAFSDHRAVLTRLVPAVAQLV